MKKIVFLLSLVLFSTLLGNEFLFFHSHSCPHCKHAIPFIKELKAKYPSVTFRFLEVSGSKRNMKHYKKTVKDLKIPRIGVPLFVIGKRYVIGYSAKTHKIKIVNMIDRHLGEKNDRKKKVQDRDQKINRLTVGK